MTGYTRGGVQLPFKAQASYSSVPTPPAASANASLNAIYATAQTGYQNYAGYSGGQYGSQGYQQRVQPQTVMDDYERESSSPAN